MKFFLIIFLFMLGSALGSFCCCQAWRIRYRELGKKNPGKWSVCLKCGHKLSWYENVPIFSWLFLKGRCKQCKTKIGLAEILSEVIMGLSFGLLGILIDINNTSIIYWCSLLIFFIFLITLGFLAIYDGKWGELPVFALVALNIYSGILLILQEVSLVIQNTWSNIELINILGAILILFGSYFVLYKISKGKWVGDGDAYLGLAMALVVKNAWLALWILFIANFLGCIIMLPQKSRKKQIYLGPFLAIGFIVVVLCSNFLLNLL